MLFKAREIMTTNIMTVKKDTPVYDAVRLLVKHRITGLPVVNDKNELLGIISEKDMLRLLYEESATERAVADLMTADVVCFSADDDLTDVCDCFLANSFRRVPILEDGKLAGLISRGDIMKFILESRNQA